MIHKIKKKYIKTNLIGFIIAGIIVSGVVVYAAVTFPSNEVSYSNIESGLNSNNVQGAIDELYETCTALTAGEQIIENAGLEKDPYECRYFFTGATPNNYITFNEENAGWRIISVECDGRIKIMKNRVNDVIGPMVWDTSNSNNWARPASLNTYLNRTYYNNILTSTAQRQIVSSDYSIGAITNRNNDLKDQINDENSSKWNGKIALPTVSEYLRSNSNESSCSTFRLNNNNYTTCKNTNWMFNKDTWVTLSPYSGNGSRVFLMNSDGSVFGNNTGANSSYNIRPTVYLSSDIKIISGNGNSSNPYVIE